jgi:hypothetical protein
VSEVVNRELLKLKEQKDRLLTLRLTLASRLQRVQSNLRGGRAVRSENFQELVRFFPAIDQDRFNRRNATHVVVIPSACDRPMQSNPYVDQFA